MNGQKTLDRLLREALTALAARTVVGLAQRSPWRCNDEPPPRIEKNQE